jgi:hypothetical protein
MLVFSDPENPICTLTDIITPVGEKWDANTVPDEGDSGILFRTQRQAGPCH